MKTIVIITTSYPSASDGSEAAGSFVQDFAEELSRKAKVLVLAPGNPQLNCNVHNSLQVFRYRASDGPLSLLRLYNPAHWAAIARVLSAGATELEQLIKREAVDHIFALWVLPSGAWAMAMKKKYGIPYSTWALGSDIWTLGKIPIVRSWLRKVLRSSTNNFADGYQLCADVEEHSSLPCKFLPSARQFPTFESSVSLDKQGCNLGFLGRWHPNKGIDLLLDALQLLADADWQQINEIRIFGGGPLEKQIKSSVAQLLASGRNVSLGGYLDKAKAAELFAWSDFVLIPSRIESIPVVFSDAMKAGKPVVATPVGDLKSLIQDYQCGLTATAATAEAIADAIKLGIRMDKEVFKVGITRAANDFALPVITDRFISMI